MSTLTFENYLQQQFDESFLKSMKQGYQQSYQQSLQPSNNQNFEKFSQTALPAIKKAGTIAQSFSKKTGIPLPLATALIASGITGGPAAVPFAALLYFVKKPLMKGASAGFDAGVKNIQKSISRSQPQGQQQPQLQPEHVISFRDYCMYQESISDWTGGKIGSVAGKISGNTTKAGRVVKQGFSQLAKFASENKLAIGKAAFLMGLGALVGGGVGKITSSAIDSVIQQIGDAGVPAEELEWLRNNFKLNVSGTGKNGDGQLRVGGEELAGDETADSLFQQRVAAREAGQDIVDPRDNFDNTNIMDASNFYSMKSNMEGILDKSGSISAREIIDPSGNSFGKTGALQYSVTIKPELGESEQSVLQKVYRQLAQDLNKSDIKITQFSRLGGDSPGEEIKAMLSVAPNLTAAGAATGAAASMQKRKQS